MKWQRWHPHNCQQVTPNVGPTGLSKNKPKVGPGPFKTCFGAFQNFKIEPTPPKIEARGTKFEARGLEDAIFK